MQSAAEDSKVVETSVPGPPVTAVEQSSWCRGRKSSRVNMPDEAVAVGGCLAEGNAVDG